MKKHHSFLLALIISFTSVSFAQAQTLQLLFEDIRGYTDFSYQGLSAERTQAPFEREIRRNLESSVEAAIEEGQTLEITFLDIDLAGEIQPWRNPSNADVRYVESIYPPRIHLRYRLLDAEGEVVKEDEARISDIAFLTRASFNLGSDSFFYESSLLKDWVRRTFRN